jgi:hypothetical protein
MVHVVYDVVSYIIVIYESIPFILWMHKGTIKFHRPISWILQYAINLYAKYCLLRVALMTFIVFHAMVPMVAI